MSTALRLPDTQVLRAADRLAAEFRDAVPESVVRTTVLRARADLEGQIVPESMEEMLHRLAYYRLGRWTPDKS